MPSNLATRSNYFVVSQISQLITTKKFIAEKNISSASLIILQTPLYKDLDIKISENASQSKDFKEVIIITQPNYPMAVNRDNVKSLISAYREFLQKIEKDSFFYFFSFKNHYAIFIKLLEDFGCKISLIEEGTGTYVGLIESYYPKRAKFHNLINVILFKRFNKRVASTTSLASFGLLKELGSILKSMLLSPINTVGFIKELFFAELIRRELYLDQEGFYKTFLNGNYNFDYVYLSFPELGKKIYNSDNFCFFYPHTVPDLKLINTLDIQADDWLFVTQYYAVPDEVYASSLVDIMIEFVDKNNRRLFVKFHPRNLLSTNKRIAELIDKKGYEDKVIVIKDTLFAVEDIISIYKPEGILGLTSSALIYAPFSSSSIQVYSVTRKWLKVIKSSTPKRVVKTIERHQLLVEKFPSIKLYN